MHTPFTHNRRASFSVLFSILLSSLSAPAAPTAVNDSYAVSEDTVLNVSTGGVLIGVTWDAGADGFAYADDVFVTASPTFASGTNPATAGDNGIGGIHVLVGPRYNQQG